MSKSAIYDNWGRLVTAALRRQKDREIALRTPSDLSFVSSSSSFNSGSFPYQVLSFGSWSVAGEPFTYPQIFEATDHFDNSKLIKKGQSGDLYHGVLESGLEVVIKMVNVSSLEKELSLISEMEICQKVNHSRVLPLLGHCLQMGNEQFRVYKFMPNKDMSKFLGGKIDKDQHLTPSLNWRMRLKIAAQVAEGLCYLHYQRSPPIVHRDIQASSILLDDNFEVRLGSFTGACIEEKSNSPNRISRFLGLETSSWSSNQKNSGAYIATRTNDVYGFGKVLLELITGKPGLSAANDSITKDLVENILNYIVLNDKKLIHEIVDSSLSTDEFILEQVWAVAFIAKACLNPNPVKRPKMANIFKVLEDHKDNKIVFLDGETKFGLEELKRASLERLGRGTVGFSFKAKLEKGPTV